MGTNGLAICFGCHQRPDRSFYYKGKQFPICARCTGELVGIILGLLTLAFFQLPVLLNFLLLIPLVTDGFTQLLTKYESNNILRLITGILFGYGLTSLLIIPLHYAFDLGYHYQKNH